MVGVADALALALPLRLSSARWLLEQGTERHEGLPEGLLQCQNIRPSALARRGEVDCDVLMFP